DCDSTGAVLGQARASLMLSGFANAPMANTSYPVALASKLAKTDLAKGAPSIIAQFSSSLDSSTCNLHWYYGFDGNTCDEDLTVVLLHEFGHGLGFIGNVDAATGRYRVGVNPSVFDRHVMDDTTGKHFDEMTDLQRAAASINNQHLVWDGSSTKDGAALYLIGPTLTISAPESLNVNYTVNTASWGAKPTAVGVTTTVVGARDDANAAGPTALDGCTAFTNASEINGHIALIDRGNCNFTVKAKNAQVAGAIGVVIADNVVDSIPPLGGCDPGITIPVYGVSQKDGQAIRAQLVNGVTARLYADPLKQTGANSGGLTRLYAPATVAAGSSLYHWDVTASPNLLMEPFINQDLKPTSVDLTLNELLDIGWTISSSNPVTPVPQTPVPGRRILRRGR
ncbi:MAG: PA domain-containing protein, partial [Acidobacteriota bacterium]